MQVMIIMGSDSDWKVMSAAAKVMDEFEIDYEAHVSSAHRTPERTIKLVRDAQAQGAKVLIAGAGAAAHLAGVIAAVSLLPIVAVPLAATAMNGLDALLATVMMPGGVPVATMAIGEAGAKNAGLFALRILALEDKRLAERLEEFRKDMAEKVEAKDRKLQELVGGK